jgi:hypothetical protein
MCSIVLFDLVVSFSLSVVASVMALSLEQQMFSEQHALFSIFPTEETPVPITIEAASLIQFKSIRRRRTN